MTVASYQGLEAQYYNALSRMKEVFGAHVDKEMETGIETEGDASENQ